MTGYFSIERDLLEHHLWLDEPFSRGQAWVDLIGLANHTHGWIRIAGERIAIARGQCGWSEVKLAERWHWSRGKVRRFLSELRRDERILQTQNTRTTVITICNYDMYQGHHDFNGTSDSTTDGHQTVQQTDTNNNDKNDKNDKKKGAYAFSGKVIRLNQRDFDSWKTAYHSIPDLRAELTAIDDTLSESGETSRWFQKVSAWLRTKHEKKMIARAGPWKDRPDNRMPSPAGG